ncbi:hypothetical protein [Pseudonocardia asaccharolytica]|uniref:Uncharacterized protein n=1 Tax=Pseudonocardia asaccharolytica DSM 44247 = NBRC 16224 TaxID=1123024 RepID=A0A511D029_9PSEU|nr:hypothetical protein [Pseudonocardia asaccharolytica]GEL18149.1 hypothetical protein PA7_19860 [Pseudonocardia asaccharolytica DSM 44247 = NBRC 16224]
MQLTTTNPTPIATISVLSDGNPLLLTTEGEFVIKNLVLIAGALFVAATLPARRRA